MNGNERYILEGIIIVLAAAYIFYENVLMSFILSPYVYIHYRQRIKERDCLEGGGRCSHL